MPAWEKVAPEPASRSHLRRSPGSTTQVRSPGALGPGSCASGDDRSACGGRSESATQQGRITHQARHSGAITGWCAASCALSPRRYRSRFAAAALQVHVRGRLGEILPGPAAPSPDAATLCRPGKPASRHHIAATGHDWPLRRIRARPSAGDELVAPRCTDPARPGPGQSHCCHWPLLATSADSDPALPA